VPTRDDLDATLMEGDPVNESAIRDALIEHWKYAGIDEIKSSEIYHDDAVLEFPQSGERFVGVDNFRTWRAKYPANLDFRIRRITHDRSLWVVENLISYDGGPWMFTVSILEFREEKVAHERIYIMDGWDAADSRAQWAERFDPLAAMTPAEWRESARGRELEGTTPPPG
jgi:hypothetical protein